MKRRLTLGALAAAIGVASCVQQAKHPATRATPTRPATTGRPAGAPASASQPDAAGPGRPDEAQRPAQLGARPIRVALATRLETAALGATGEWQLLDQNGATVVTSGERGETVSASRLGGPLRLERVVARESSFGPPAGATPIVTRDGSFVLRAANAGDYVTFAGRQYRGELVISADAASGVVVVNRVGAEDYLRGVLPLEIGDRPPGEDAAAQAQAVAARSYAYAHLAPARAWDVLSTVSDQVYGGVAAERASGDRAVVATAGLVLTYGGRVISAPYHSTCGGQTASPSEVWQGAADEPYLRSVSDRVGSSDRFYCDGSPRFTWTRTLDAATLDDAVARYLRDFVPVRPDGPGAVRAVRTEGTTATGRAAAVVVGTSRGSYALRGNAMRFVLRPSGGEILNSTYFTVDPQSLRGGAPLTLRGRGYGHGVGMCQWGAIGRARAGQDFRTILSTYYPGTRVERVD